MQLEHWSRDDARGSAFSGSDSAVIYSDMTVLLPAAFPVTQPIIFVTRKSQGNDAVCGCTVCTWCDTGQ